MRLAGKIAVITGAGSGLGRAMSVRFAQEGADILVADINEAGANETADLVRAEGRRARVQRVDVRSKADVEAMIAAAVAEFGRVDIMVSNAGVTDGATFLELSEESWDRVIGVNLKGVFLCGQAAAKQMIKQGEGGRIISIASIMGEIGSAGSAAYCSSKAGVRLLTKSMAIALAPHGITANAIGPGFIETPMTAPLREDASIQGKMITDRTPRERMGEPSDVAAVAVFLASDESINVTGTTIFTDGGITAGLYSADVRRAREAMLAGTQAPR